MTGRSAALTTCRKTGPQIPVLEISLGNGGRHTTPESGVMGDADRILDYFGGCPCAHSSSANFESIAEISDAYLRCDIDQA